MNMLQFARFESLTTQKSLINDNLLAICTLVKRDYQAGDDTTHWVGRIASLVQELEVIDAERLAIAKQHLWVPE